MKHTVPCLNVLIQTPTGNSPLTEPTYFCFSSVIKNFTSTTVLNIYVDGWRDYKAHVTDLIPGTNLPNVPSTSV